MSFTIGNGYDYPLLGKGYQQPFGNQNIPLINGDFVVINHRNQMDPFQQQMFQQQMGNIDQYYKIQQQIQATMGEYFAKMAQQQIQYGDLRLKQMREQFQKDPNSFARLTEKLAKEKNIDLDKSGLKEIIELFDKHVANFKNRISDQALDYEIIQNDDKLEKMILEEDKKDQDNISSLQNNATIKGDIKMENRPYENYFSHKDIVYGIGQSIRSQATEEGVAMRDRTKAFMPDTASRGDSNLIIAHVHDDFYWRQRIIFAVNDSNLSIEKRPCLVLFYKNNTFKIVNNLLVLPKYSNHNSYNDVIQDYLAELTVSKEILKFLHFDYDNPTRSLNTFIESTYPETKTQLSVSEMTILDQFDTLAFPSIYQPDYRVTTRMTINEYRKRLKTFIID